jgi:hypothetical protein
VEIRRRAGGCRRKQWLAAARRKSAKTPDGTIDMTPSPSHNGGMRWKRVLTVGAIVAAAAGAIAGGSLLLTYHEATKIDRTNPEVVLIRYLDATFERKDPATAGLYTCSKPEGLAPINAMQADLTKREKDFAVTISVTNGAMTRTQNVITTTLTMEAFKDGGRNARWTESWRFRMVNEEGWRVCGAEMLAAPTASPSASAPSSSAVPSL